MSFTRNVERFRIYQQLEITFRILAQPIHPFYSALPHEPQKSKAPIHSTTHSISVCISSTLQSDALSPPWVGHHLWRRWDGWTPSPGGSKWKDFRFIMRSTSFGMSDSPSELAKYSQALNLKKCYWDDIDGRGPRMLTEIILQEIHVTRG